MVKKRMALRKKITLLIAGLVTFSGFFALLHQALQEGKSNDKRSQKKIERVIKKEKNDVIAKEMKQMLKRLETTPGLAKNFPRAIKDIEIICDDLEEIEVLSTFPHDAFKKVKTPEEAFAILNQFEKDISSAEHLLINVKGKIFDLNLNFGVQINDIFTEITDAVVYLRHVVVIERNGIKWEKELINVKQTLFESLER